MNTALFIAGFTALVAVVAAVGGSVRVLQKAATSGSITVRRKGSEKSVVLPQHYSEKAVRELLELVA